jgi:putative flippase GtrA
MISLLDQFKSRQHGAAVQFVKYAISGGVATAVHVTLFYLAAYAILPALNQNDVVCRTLNLQVPPVTDAIRARNATINNVVVSIFSNLTAYLINIGWVFESGRHARWLEVGYFYLVGALSMVTGTALMGFLIHTVGITTTHAFVINSAVALVINFLLRKFFIFKR